MRHQSPSPRRSSRRPRLARLTTVATAWAAISALALSSASAGGGERIGDPVPDVPQGPVNVGLALVTTDVTAPLAGITAPGQSRKLYIVDQIGQLKELSIDAPRPVAHLATILDVSPLLVGPRTPRTSGDSSARPSPPMAGSSPTLPKHSTQPCRPPSHCLLTRPVPAISRAPYPTIAA
ncbi:hypothetical protein ACX80O_06860 [Arthrobacter sp. Hz1]